MPSTHSLCVASLFLLAACTSAPNLSIPEPLPEALEWARPATSEGRVFLGLKTRENDSGSLDALFFEPGVRVVRVVESSPAADAGIEVGDVVLGWGKHEVNDPAALETLVQGAAGGDEIGLRVGRDDTVFEVPVTLRLAGGATAPEPEVLYRRDPSRSRAGWITGGGGALLVASDPEAPFPDAGVPVGSVVTALEGREVLSARELIRELATHPPGADVTVSVRFTDGSTDDVDVELQSAPTKVTGLSIPILVSYDADADGESTEFVLIDLYLISLFRYTRHGAEREYRFLRWFQFSSGMGELAE